ncbi:hypothetical protein AYL99_07051 [Fonsecaea erecta]|uniref:Uncharacterized protein n=1 Tax=Fonsecaea erecta TaxID=1367422 RepID=A0A178ZEP4_9EURO|nr:hypothetical protein AYL99_07051 [Fonsecaea erecta]OAP57961.1 hypothetical protein AYL99_07051 [Fonsecaea erecta]
MLTQTQPRTHHTHLALSRKESRTQIPQENCVYLAIALMGGMILVTRPVLVLLAFLLVGYGRLYHIEQHDDKSERRLFSHEPRRSGAEHSLHLGPGPGHQGHEQKRAGLHELAKALNLPKVRVEGDKKWHLH